MIVYYIGGPADLVKQSLPDNTTLPPVKCLPYTMAVRSSEGLLVKRHFYRLVTYLQTTGVWIYEYDPSIEEVQ